MIKKLGPAEDGRMWRKETRQRSFAEQSIVGGNGCNARLEGIAELLDWGALERELAAVYAAGEGRPAYRPLVMFKALLLQQWYQLSDPGLEEALVDRLSFRRFIGLGLEEAVPDHSTLSRFRSQLAARGLGERLLEALNRQLEQRGLMLKRGTLLDATVVAAAVKPSAGPKGSVAPGQGARRTRTPSRARVRTGLSAITTSATRRTSGSISARAWCARQC
jgi:IS5 family transposase